MKRNKSEDQGELDNFNPEEDYKRFLNMTPEERLAHFHVFQVRTIRSIYDQACDFRAMEEKEDPHCEDLRVRQPGTCAFLRRIAHGQLRDLGAKRPLQVHHAGQHTFEKPQPGTTNTEP